MREVPFAKKNGIRLSSAWGEKPFSVTGGTTAIIKPGGGLRLLYCALSILAPSDSKDPIYCGTALKARISYSTTAIFLHCDVSNFEMMPQKTHSLAQGPSHLATPFIKAQRSQGFFTTWPAIPSVSVVLPLRREACFPVAGSPFCGPPAWVLSSVAFFGRHSRWRRVASCDVGATGLAPDHLLQTW